LFNRAVFLTFVTLIWALVSFLSGATPDNPVAGRWAAHSPDPIGRTEDIELHFSTGDNGLTGVLHTPDREIPLAKIKLQGRNLTFDAVRDLRGKNILYHFDGTLSGDTLDFTVQNDDGSSFIRFTAHRVP
jgi:hypothetical protein